MSKDYRGKSFKNQNLVNQDFSYADIRGTDFTNAIIKNTNFTGVRAGLKLNSIIFLLIGSFLLAIFSGVSSIINAGIVFFLPFLLFVDRLENQIKILDILLVITIKIDLLIFLATVVRQGFLSALRRGLLFLLPFLILATVFSGEISQPGRSFILGTILLSLAAISLSTSALSAAGAIVILEFIPILLILVINLITTTSVSVVLCKQIAPIVGISGVTTTLIFSAIGNYIAWQALKENEKFTWIRILALTFASIGGTCFQGADLTNANFTLSLLKSTNFRGAKLTRTYWFNAQKLHLSLVGESYLKNLQLRQLLVTRQGQDKNFDRQDLRGFNLQGAKLVDSSLICADLSEANLQDTDLSRAKLVQTQLDGTDLTGATLTGATIEDWNITNRTILQGVRCDYVFMRLPTPDDPNPHRKPDNWNETFADGDFADFIKPIVDTLDLYHNSGVDPRAIAVSFKQLAENHPEAELRIVGMEVKGEDKFLLRAKTVLLADKSELSIEYFTIYNELKALAQQEVKALISEKDYQIHRLENMVTTALERPSFYAQTYNNQGDTTMSSDRNINMGSGNYNERIEGDYVQGDYREGKKSHFNLQGAQFGGGLVDAETVNAHQIGGNITNYPSRQKQNPELVKTILILAANPTTTISLRLDEEVREIEEGLKRAKKREQFDLKQKWAVRVQDVYRSLLDFKPQIVHFSGHGAGDDGLVLEDETGNVRLVETVALASLFELFAGNIECVVLNACYSEVQANAIIKHIPYVIGMNKEIGDKAAIKFATGFYNALGAGESVEFAYKLGCSVIQLDGIAENLTPVLKKK